MKRMIQLWMVMSAGWAMTVANAQMTPSSAPQANDGCAPIAVQCSMEVKPQTQKTAKTVKRAKKAQRIHAPKPKSNRAGQSARSIAPAESVAKPMASPAP